MVRGKFISVQFPRAPSSPDDQRTPGQAEHHGKVVCEGGGDGRWPVVRASRSPDR